MDKNQLEAYLKKMKLLNPVKESESSDSSQDSE
jgi:hypothetical protein